MLAQLAQFGANKYFIHINKLTEMQLCCNENKLNNTNFLAPFD